MRYFILSAIMALITNVAWAEIGLISGDWITQDEDAKIQIADCGDGTPCGTLVWVDPTAPGGGLDAENRETSLRSRSLIGLEIISGYEKRKGTWRNGRIYNPQDGKTFRSSLQLRSDNKLIVKGCLGPICRSNTWTRSSTQTGAS